MSVIVTIRVPGNAADLESYAAGPGGDVLRRISEVARAAGATRHRFAAAPGGILVIDEWPDEETFQKFFANQPEIGDVMRDAGAQGPPEITFSRVLHTPDQF